MKFILVIPLLFIATLCFASQRQYQFENKTVIDVSGVKPVEAIAQEFGGTLEDWVEVPVALISQDELDTQKAEAEKEAVIQEKIRQIAVDALVSDGVIAVDETTGKQILTAVKIEQINK